MKSKWFNLREEAIAMRQKSASIKDIEDKLKIPRSTLSGWFRTIKLTRGQKDLIYKRWRQRLRATRKLAIAWHNNQKLIRLKEAELQASESLKNIDIHDPSVINLALSMLYLGEGFKKKAFGMGNSDSMILKLFVSLLLKTYLIPIDKISCELHLRADQNPNKIKKYWSKELGLPISRFRWVSLDQRTVGSPTYPHYKGVCIVRCGSIAIQRKLLYTSKIFCEKVIDRMRA
ncbi:MAG TPA: hypothetical protein VI981_04155 [Candidatus Paceibacterota bacterium]